MSRLSRLLRLTPEDPLQRTLRLPAHAAYIHWDLGTRPLAQLEFDITMHTDPGTTTGEYLAPWNGTIDGHEFYFGIQSNVHDPERGGVGKGCIFSTWWTFDAADTRPESDGFIELGTHEGTFVGVRRTFEWSVGDYRLTLGRADHDGDGDWFAMSIQPIAPVTAPVDPSGPRPEPTGPAAPLGALRFRRAHPDLPATVAPHGPAFIEVYDNARTYGDIDDWSLDLMAYGDGRRAVAARSEYPAFPYAAVPNVDVSLVAERDRVAMAFGRSVQRTHPAGTLF